MLEIILRCLWFESKTLSSVCTTIFTSSSDIKCCKITKRKRVTFRVKQASSRITVSVSRGLFLEIYSWRFPINCQLPKHCVKKKTEIINRNKLESQKWGVGRWIFKMFSKNLKCLHCIDHVLRRTILEVLFLVSTVNKIRSFKTYNIYKKLELWTY